MPPDRDPPLARASAALTALARRSGAAAFLRWWGAELAPLVPRSARNALAQRRMRPILAFDGQVATVWQPRMVDGVVRVEPVATIALDGDAQGVAAAGRKAVADLARAANRAGAPRVRLAIAARSVLRRTLTLPAALGENLRQAVGYDLDRLTPFKADELYHDVAIVARDPARGTITADFAAVRRPVVDTALAYATGWGADVRGVTPDLPDAPPSRLNLAPEEARVAPAPWRRWQFWAPLAALCAVTVVAVVLPLWQKRDYAIATIQRAQAAHQQALVSEKLRAELDRAVSDYNFALERKYAFPPIVRVLDTMSTVLPDDTWVTQLEVRTLPRGRDREREFVLRGESGNAGGLIPILENSGLVAHVAPRSPVTKIQPGPGEIFDLGGEIKAAAKPSMVALADLPPPAAAPVAQAPRPAAPSAGPKPAAATEAGAAEPSPAPMSATADPDAGADASTRASAQEPVRAPAEEQKPIKAHKLPRAQAQQPRP